MTRKDGRMRWMGALILLTAMTAATQAQERTADHDELRAMLKTVATALNSRNLDAIAPLCHEKFAISTVDQQVFVGLPAFERYFKGLFTGDKASLKSIAFNPTADVLTEFVGENTGLARGTSKIGRAHV